MCLISVVAVPIILNFLVKFIWLMMHDLVSYL